MCPGHPCLQLGARGLITVAVSLKVLFRKDLKRTDTASINLKHEVDTSHAYNFTITLQNRNAVMHTFLLSGRNRNGAGCMCICIVSADDDDDTKGLQDC